MGHTTLDMTLEYARILDQTVEQAFNTAVDQMILAWPCNAPHSDDLLGCLFGTNVAFDCFISNHTADLFE